MKKQYDVLVAGGGFTGVAAAVSAARKGKSVLLVERAGCLGGAATNNLVLPFMGYWTQKDGEKLMISAGLFGEMVDEMAAAGRMDETKKYFDTEYLKVYFDRLVAASGADVLLSSTVVSAKKEGDRITGVSLYTKEGIIEVAADIFIDATGDAELAAISGVPCETGRKKDGLCQPMTLCFRMCNVDTEAFYNVSREQLNSIYRSYQQDGRISDPREDVLWFRTLLPGVVHFNTTRVIRKDPTGAADVTAAEIEAREQTQEIVKMLIESVPGFEHAALMQTAPQIGVRESRRVIGRHMLTQEELKACTVFDDSIAVGRYDIDIHDPDGAGTSHYYFEAGTYYTIPYASLLPKSGGENLIVAGRCISATHEAQASIRIMPICCCLGEAAGTAAALAAEGGVNPPDIDIRALQTALEKNGAKVR